MKSYIVYSANNDDYLTNQEFEFEYTAEASDEEEAKQKAIVLFQENNTTLNLDDYTYGFVEN